MATSIGGNIDLGDGIERPLVTTTMWAPLAGARIIANLYNAVYKWDHTTETGSNTNLGFQVIMDRYKEEIKTVGNEIVTKTYYKGKVMNGAAVLCRSIVITGVLGAFLGPTVYNSVLGYVTFDAFLVIPGGEFTTIEVVIVSKIPLTDLTIQETSYTNQKEMMKYCFFYTGRTIEEDAVWYSTGAATDPAFDLTTQSFENVVAAVKANPEKLLTVYTFRQLAANYKLEVVKLPNVNNKDLDLKSTIYVRAGGTGSAYEVRLITNKQWWLLMSVPLNMTTNHALRTVFSHKARLI